MAHLNSPLSQSNGNQLVIETALSHLPNREIRKREYLDLEKKLSKSLTGENRQFLEKTISIIDDNLQKERFVSHFFELSENTKNYLKSLSPKFGFGGFGESAYYRTYSRRKEDGSQEHWADTIIRVTEGILSIRKDHMIKHRLTWDDSYWQNFARGFSESMFKMQFLPPGRAHV